MSRDGASVYKSIGYRLSYRWRAHSIFTIIIGAIFPLLSCQGIGDRSTTTPAVQANRAMVPAAPLGNPSTITGNSNFERLLSCARLSHPSAPDMSTQSLDDFTRPTNADELLRNLSAAAKNELFLQPVFYGDDALLKFFGARRVIRDDSGTREGINLYQITASVIGSSVFPRSTIALRTVCYVVSRQLKAGGTKSNVILIANLNVTGPPIADLTLYNVRQFFGTELQNVPNAGQISDGGLVPPMEDKGYVLYSNAPIPNPAGIRIESDFYFALDNPIEQAPTHIVDTDIVLAIKINAERRREIGAVNNAL